MHVSVFAHHAVAVSHYTAKLQDRAPLQAQCTECHILSDRESSYKKLSQLALDLVASPASQAYVERLILCVVIAQQENETELECPCLGRYF